MAVPLAHLVGAAAEAVPLAHLAVAEAAEAVAVPQLLAAVAAAAAAAAVLPGVQRAAIGTSRDFASLSPISFSSLSVGCHVSRISLFVAKALRSKNDL